MPLIYWLAVGVLAISLIGMLAFTALPAARRFKRECWGDLPLDWKVGLVLFIYLGLLGDFVFNQTRAAWIFRGFSKLLLSNRIQRRVDRWAAGARTEAPDGLTRRWVRILNTGDAGHIKLPDGWPW